MTLHQPFYEMAKENTNELIIFCFVVVAIIVFLLFLVRRLSR